MRSFATFLHVFECAIRFLAALEFSAYSARSLRSTVPPGTVYVGNGRINHCVATRCGIFELMFNVFSKIAECGAGNGRSRGAVSSKAREVHPPVYPAPRSGQLPVPSVLPFMEMPVVY